MFRAIRNTWQSEFFKNIATLISGTSFAQAFSIIIYIVLSRIFTEEDFGVFGLYMNILNITLIFSTAKYELAILLPKSDRESVNLLGLSGMISVGVSFVLLVIVVFFNDLICRLLGSEEISTWLYFIPLSTLLVGLFTSLRNYSNREKRYKLIAGANIGQSLSNSLLKLGLGLVIVGAAGLIYGVVFGQLVGFLIFLAVHVRVNRGKAGGLQFSEMKRLGKQYSLFPKYNMWQGLINNLSGALPVFLFSSFFSMATAGFYTFGYMILYRPVSLLANAFYQVMFQRFVEKQHHESSILPEVLLFIRRTIQVLLIPFIVIGIFAPEIFGFVFGEKWIEAGKYAQIILPWIFMVSLVMPLSFIPDLYRKQRVAMIIDGVKLMGRLAGLMVGVMMENVYIGLGLYSLSSTLMILYSLLWYIRLVRNNLPGDGSGSTLKENDG
ncbi:MAG: oligosaccharide flippase family protein [Bacteroidales bacterium]|nr:oligosaccharide flippase family protein [Bacteroidales bacterium]